MIPLLGFSPDVEPTTPGAITDCDNIVPYDAGNRAASSPVDVGLAALAAACQGSAVTRDLSGNSRLFAGTSAKLYEASGSSWTDVSSGGYSLSADDRWRYAIFGNSSLAVCPSVGLQLSNSGAFAAVAGAPKAKCLVVCKGFVLLFATNEGTYGDSPDRWWCSEYLNASGWTPAVSTQCTTGRLIEGSGPITAALRMGDTVVAYKDRAIFVGQYVGAPSVWQWSPPVGDVGALGPEAVVDTPVGHIFAGSDNIYLFDGTRPTPIATAQVRQWWLDNSSSTYRYKTKLLWDRDNNLVFVFFPSTSSSTCDTALAYHVLTKQWGKVTISVEAVINYTSQGITYDGGSPLVTTYDGTTLDLSYDSPFWLASKSSPAVFKTDHKVYSLTGVPGASYFVTGDYGDESEYTTCSALRVRWAQRPVSPTCTGMVKDTSGDDLSSGSSGTFDGSKFPLRQTNRFHRFRVDMSGAAKFSAVQPDLVSAGSR